ncbi:MAG: YcgN family cysteine cluster protein [Hyphomonadaceae bacterium]
MSAAPFWKTKSLSEMNEAEWESLCDGCAKCCLVKLEDEDTSEIYFTSLRCRLLDPASCRCSDYPNRKKKVPICVKLTPETVASVDWLPPTCAYLLVHQGEDLPDWHPLVCGDPEEVHRRGVSARNRTTNEDDVDDEDALDYIADWANRPPSYYARRSRGKKKV